MSYFKVTHGFVMQEFDENDDCVSQEFTCGDECEYEDDKGEPIDAPVNETYQPYDMVQPIVDLAHAIAEALEKAAPDGIVVGEDERAVIADVIRKANNGE